MNGIKAEIVAFFVAVIAGGTVRMGYQCIICIRRIFRHKRLWVEIEDIIFWLFAAVYLFVQIYYTSDGILRWYFALGVVFGAVISTFFLWKMKKMLKKIYDFHAGKNIAKNEKKRYYYKQ